MAIRQLATLAIKPPASRPLIPPRPVPLMYRPIVVPNPEGWNSSAM